MKRYLLLGLVLVLTLSLTACGGKSSKEAEPIKIGYVNPTTGALAGNGEGCEWVVNQITEYVNAHPITVDGVARPIKVIVYDSTSDQNVCSEMAQKLIEEDHIDLMGHPDSQHGHPRRPGGGALRHPLHRHPVAGGPAGQFPGGL